MTQASSAIPVVPLYIALLYKVMKAKGTHEGCVEQIHRLFADRLATGADPQLDEAGRIRIDDWEMQSDVQATVAELWPKATTENLPQLSDIAGYRAEFLKLFDDSRSRTCFLRCSLSVFYSRGRCCLRDWRAG